MKCKYCQAELTEESAVCPECGASLEEELTIPEPLEEEKVTATEETAAEEVSAEEAAPEEQTELGEEPVEYAPPKRKLWVKVTAVVCCVVLFLGLAAGVWYGINGSLLPRKNDILYKDCYTAEDDKAVAAAEKVVATIGDKELTNAQLQIYYWTSVYEFVNKYNSYLQYMGLDFTKPLSEQSGANDGQTWEQFFLTSALSTWHRYQALMIEAESAGYVMSDVLKENLDAIPASFETTAQYYGFANVEEMVHSDMGAAASMDAYMDYLNIYYGGTEYFETIYQSLLPTREEVEAYYEANAEQIETDYKVNKESGRLIDVRHILICPKGGTTGEDGNTVTYSQEEWDTCKTEADSLLETWLQGEGTEASFAALANEASEDPGSNTNGGLYTYVNEGKMVAAFNDWCFDESRQPGDIGMVQTEFGYHIMYFVYGEEGWLRYAEQELVAERGAALLEQCMEENPMKVNYKKIVLGEANLAG